MPDTLLATDNGDLNTVPWTQREIEQQPETLQATQAVLRAHPAEIDGFVAPLLARPELRIVLTGAGTSAFVGECLAPWLSQLLGRSVEAVATTDIVSAPLHHLRRETPTLLVSFGRSGSSPESVAAVELLDAHVDQAYHLVVTCNAEGALAQRTNANTKIVVLPEATHDRGFAMTSSFSAMMLAALSILGGVARSTRASPRSRQRSATRSRAPSPWRSASHSAASSASPFSAAACSRDWRARRP
jgi:tagatose-6-phosphate ketose/aldose isomerase